METEYIPGIIFVYSGEESRPAGIFVLMFTRPAAVPHRRLAFDLNYDGGKKIQGVNKRGPLANKQSRERDRPTRDRFSP